jgi:cytochrome P450
MPTATPTPWKSGASNAPPPPVQSLRPVPPDLVDRVGETVAFFLTQYREFGSIFRFAIPYTNQRFTVLAGPDANRFMLHAGKEHLSAREFRREQNQEFGAERSLVSIDGQEHYELRKLQKRGYSRTVMQGKADQVVALVREMVNEWAPGEVKAVGEFMPRLITRQLGKIVLNYPADAYLDDIPRFLQTVLRVTITRHWSRQALNDPAYLLAKRRVFELADRMIESHRAQQDARAEPDLLDDLLAALAEDDSLFTEDELRLAALGPYIGGLDPVANTCAFMLYALLRQPELLEQVQAEVDAAFAAGAPTDEILKAMKALHHTALETLRLYPVAPAIQGTVARPFEFAGYRMDEGENVIIASTITHFLPEFYPEPFEFDVDRFAPPRSEHRPAGVFVPYGMGPHICLGAGMAETQIMLTLGALLHTAALALEPAGYTMMIEGTPTPAPDNHFAVRLIHRR